MSSGPLLTSFATAAATAAALILSAQGVKAQAPSAPAATAPAQALVVQVCQGCHGPEILSQKGRTKDEWATVVQTMVDRGAMASDQDLQTIVDYLARTYPPAVRASAK